MKPALKISILLAAWLCLLSPEAHSAAIPAQVESAILNMSPEESLELLLSFDNDLDLAALKIRTMRDKLNRRQQYLEVMEGLLENRRQLERSVSAGLEAMKRNGQVISFEFFTVSNTVLVTAKAGCLDELLSLPGVRLVNLNSEVSLIPPISDKRIDFAPKAASSNVSLTGIGVPQLWAQGITGAGSLVCSFDTGVDGDHPALQSKWRGNAGFPANECWFAPRGGYLPYDNIGHGSHTMGVMVGSNASDTFGVAPGAQWISAAVIDQGANLSATIGDILSAFDWALNPDGDLNTMDDVPDVINNSWGVPKGVVDDCDNTFWTAIDHLEAAGIVMIFAAGNEGPDGASLRMPADRASSPLNTLAVGSVNIQTQLVAEFSSRGPSRCHGQVKPEVVAPGVDIYSSYKDGTYRLMSGTSMSAPFVSGLVALMRQYNPEATVEQIKTALLVSATDLGPTGEDNAYGHGLINAVRALEYLPVPDRPQVQVSEHSLLSGGDIFADPGETAELALILVDPADMVDSVDVWLSSVSPDVNILPDTIRFFFASGTNYAASQQSFRLEISSMAISGKMAELTAHFLYPGTNGGNTAVFSLLIGQMPPGNMATIAAGRLSFSVSEFGQFGFGPGSIYNAGGPGLTYDGGENLLFEAGLIVGRNAWMVSDAIRGTEAGFKTSEFMPVGTDYSMAVAGSPSVASYIDGNAILPLPIRVEQTVWSSNSDYYILQFKIFNPTAERMDSLSFGLLWDFDLDRTDDCLGYDSLLGMVYQYDAAQQQFVGLLGLTETAFSFAAVDNGPDSKIGLDKKTKFALIRHQGVSLGSGTGADWMIVAANIFARFEALSSKTTALALIAGTSLDDLRQKALHAVGAYGLLLDAAEAHTAVPSQLELRQNYPNPFNPQTTIDFRLPATQPITLAVYNVIGQKVRTLVEANLPAGEHSVVWDGRDQGGKMVASGVYFYRLLAESGGSVTRKMIMVK